MVFLQKNALTVRTVPAERPSDATLAKRTCNFTNRTCKGDNQRVPGQSQDIAAVIRDCAHQLLAQVAMTVQEKAPTGARGRLGHLLHTQVGARIDVDLGKPSANLLPDAPPHGGGCNWGPPPYAPKIGEHMRLY